MGKSAGKDQRARLANVTIVLARECGVINVSVYIYREKGGFMKKVLLIVGFLLSSMFVGQAFAGSININTASVEQLQEIHGVGEKTAKAIVKHRKEHGKFKSASDLMNVKGIGEKKYAKLKSEVKVSGASSFSTDKGSNKAKHKDSKDKKKTVSKKENSKSKKDKKSKDKKKVKKEKKKKSKKDKK